MFKINLHALISLISMRVLFILPGNVMSRTMHYINYLFDYIVINGCDYMFGYKQVEILLENVALPVLKFILPVMFKSSTL